MAKAYQAAKERAGSRESKSSSLRQILFSQLQTIQQSPVCNSREDRFSERGPSPSDTGPMADCGQFCVIADFSALQ